MTTFLMVLYAIVMVSDFMDSSFNMSCRD